MKKTITKITAAVIIIAAIICFYAFRLNRFFNYENITKVKEVILGFGWFAPFILYILYIVFNLLILPTMFFNIFAGYLYGIGWGYLLSITGMSIGMICSFYAARYLFQDDFHKKFGDSKIVSEINRWTKKRPLLTVIFFRIFFIFPYNMQNVAYGLTKISAKDYIIGSIIGVAPITFGHVMIGVLIEHAAMDSASVKNVMMWVGLIIAIVASIFFTSLLVRRMFNKKNETVINDTAADNAVKEQING